MLIISFSIDSLTERNINKVLHSDLRIRTFFLQSKFIEIAYSYLRKALYIFIKTSVVHWEGSASMHFHGKHLIKRGLLGKHVPQPKSTTPGVSKRNPFMCPSALRPYYLATESHTLSAIIKDAEKYLHWWHYSALG